MSHFSPYGEVTETVILRKNGKMTGCAFVQFASAHDAVKAIRACNMKPLLGM